MLDTTPVAPRVAVDPQARARSTRFPRFARAARTTGPRRSPLHETLSVGLGLTQR